MDAKTAVGIKEFVPLSIRTRSRIVTWLWRHSNADGKLTLDRTRRLARWLP